MSIFKKLNDWEENKWNDVIEAAAEKYPDWFWKDPPEKPRRPFRFEPLMMDFWPGVLSIGYWYYKLGNLEKGHWGGYDYDNWINIPEWGEIRYLFKRYVPNPNSDWKLSGGKYVWEFNLKRIWISLWEETKTERLICRFRGHPKGEIYWNPGGDEPDHHCSTCGENIG